MSTGSRKVLVVEDEKIVQMHLSRIVESAGHHVVGLVDRIADALDSVRREAPDLVLMDIRLADGDDGIECARLISAETGASIVFLTAHSDAETLARAMPIEAAGYLVKPFRAAEVSASISTALAARDRERRARARERALTSAVDALEEALFVLDANTTIGFANPKGKALTGWKEFEGPRRFVESVAPDDRERLRDAVRESLARHASETLRNVTLAASGARVTVRLEPIDDNSDACVLATVGSALDEPASAQRHDGSPRLMVYSHDTFGLGHIRRCMNLIRAMSERMEDLSTLLVTGSPVAHKFELPPRTDYLKLPAVRKVAPDAYEPRSLGMSDEGILTLRRNLLLRTVRDYSPNLLLVDHSPTGMNGELRPVLEYLRETGSCTRILGLRDIIDSPERVAKRWAEEKMLDVLERDYDHMVVYGSRDVYATADEYGLPDALRARTTYANYVSQGVATKTVEPEVEERLVVVTIGGGDGGGETLVRPFLQLLRDRKDELAIRAEVLLGPFAPPELRAELRALAEGSPVVLHDFIPDPTPLFARAGLVISTAGYNVSAELIAHAQRALLIPRVVHRDEQLIRSRRLAELGLVDFLHPADATPDAIGERVLAALANPARPLAEARAANRVPLDGAERMAEFVEGLARARR